MQPLAIQQLSSPIDASDAGSAGTHQSNNGGGVVFNELMSAARVTANQRRASDEEMADRRAADKVQSAQEDRDAQNAVTALSAAAQFAANNVRLKQRAAAEQLSHEEAARRATEEKAAAQQSNHRDDATPDVEPTTADTAAMPELSAEQMAEKATPPISRPYDATPTQNTGDTDADANDPLPGPASSSAVNEATVDLVHGEPRVGNMTGAATTSVVEPPSPTDQYLTAVKSQQAPTVPEENGNTETTGVPATTIGVMKTQAMQPPALQTDAAKPVTVVQPTTDANANTPLLQQKVDAETQVELDKTAANEHDESEATVAPIQQPQPVAQPSDTSAIAPSLRHPR